tara:strand:- start:7107 stop:8105 length:999 start_codon:yes stop_codon:yes gene_type:complete
MNKKILIIGGCGFIGHNLALKLKKENYIVSIVDSLGVNNLKTVRENDITNKKLYKKILENRIKLLKKNKIKIFIKDAKDKKIIQTYKKIKPSIVIHLAAVSHANKSNKEPQNTFENSILSLQNSLEYCRKEKQTHIIYLSSSMVYGNFDGKKVKENTVLKPIGIYANLKFAGELMIKSYNQIFDLKYTIIRPSALYGERCVSRRVGQIFIENALNKKIISINGTGEEKLDFTYIDDLMRGIILCVKKKNSINQTFNITFGNAKKINSLLKILKAEFPKVKVKYKNWDKFTPKRGTLSIAKAKKLLGYKPTYSINVGYRKYITWYKNFFKNSI